MTTNKSLRVLVGICVISACVLGSGMQARAETLHYKFYTWSIKGERVPVGDVDGHTLGISVRGAFFVLDNGEVATVNTVLTNDYVNGVGPFMQYSTIKFPDGSTIMYKSQGTMGAGAASGAFTSEIIKGTGRFEGIKGTQSAKAKYLPVEPGEAYPKGYGEGTITYTLPSK